MYAPQIDRELAEMEESYHDDLNVHQYYDHQ
jgi:hypothetical protein